MKFPFIAEFTVIDEYFLNAGHGYLSIPVENPANASDVQFTRFGLSAPTDSFNKGWTFGIVESSPAQYARAFCLGELKFDNSTGVNRLILNNADLMGTLTRSAGLPAWFPIPEYIIYQNIDIAETRMLLNDYLTNNPEILDGLCQDVADCSDAGTYLDKFFNSDVDSGIPVPAGTTIAVAGTGTAYDRELSIFIQEELDGLLYIDPAIYPLHLEPAFLDLAGHSLYQELTNSFGPLVANGIVRFVAATGGTTGTFESVSAPARDITTAIAVSQEYDTIVVLDSNSYTDVEIIIDHPLSITSLNVSKIDVRETPSYQTYDFPSLPAVQGIGRGVRVSQVDGYVSIANLIVHNRHTSGESDPFLTGPGIFIYRSNKVYVYNCCCVGNSVTGGMSAGPYEANGGGINCYYCSPYLFRNFISGNTATYGGGIFVGPFGYPVIKENVIKENTAELDGGGICINTASANYFLPDAGMLSYGFDQHEVDTARASKVLLIGNTIQNNLAKDDGGGVYLSIMAKTGFRNNQIHQNTAWNAGGGVRATLGSDMEMNGDTILDNDANYQFKTSTDPQEQIELNMNGGGGIAARNSNLVMRDVVVANNTAHGFAGGGIYFNSSREGAFQDDSWTLTWGSGYDDYDDILRNLFGKQKVVLTLDEEVEITGNTCTKFDNTAEDFRKGGGLYILRYETDIFTALPLETLIERFSAVTGNQNDKISTISPGNAVTAVIQDTGTIESPLSHEFHLEDMVEDNILDSSTASDFVDNNGVFSYNSPPAGAQ